MRDNKTDETFRKRLAYYCKARKWTEDIFGMQWASGLNLRHLLAINQNIYIISEHRDPAEKIYAGGQMQYHFVYSAVSPLLQNFVSFRLWPEQVSRARELVVNLRKAVDDKKIPVVKLTGSIGLYWPHNDLKLQQGKADISEIQQPEEVLSRIMLIPGLHHENRDLTWWRCLSDYRTSYIAFDELTHFMTGGICIVKLDQKFHDYCQFRILGDNIRWSGQIYRFRFSGYRAQKELKSAENIYAALYFRQFDEKTGLDNFWLQDIVSCDTLDILLHLIMRKLNKNYMQTCRLKLTSVNELESLSLKCMSEISRFIWRGKNSETMLGLTMPTSQVIEGLLSGYYRKIDSDIYFIPPGMQNETDSKIKSIDNKLSSLEGKNKEKREFFRNFLQDDDAIKTTFLTWVMRRIDNGLHPWLPETMGKTV